MRYHFAVHFSLSLPYLLEDEDVADRPVQDVVDGVCDESCESCCECECGVCREVACAAQGGGVSPHPAERHEDGTLRLVRIEKHTARGREGETQQLAGGCGRDVVRTASRAERCGRVRDGNGLCWWEMKERVKDSG